MPIRDRPELAANYTRITQGRRRTLNYLYLIKKLFSHEIYQRYRHHIRVEKDQKEIYWLFKALDQLMEKYQRDISFEDFSLWVQVNLGNDYAVFLDLIKQTETDEDIIEDTLKAIKEKSLSYEIAQRALAVHEGKADRSELQDLVRQFDEIDQEDRDDPFVTTSLNELYGNEYKKPGLRWRLKALNKSLGSLRPGDFGFIFARPETGKTTFLASEVSHMAEQTDGFVLWFNNEEQDRKVMLRIIQASLGLDIKTISSDLQRYEAIYKERTGDRIKLPRLGAIHKRDIEAICKEYPAALIVTDQLSKVKGFSNDREDLRLGAIFQWARELAKEYQAPFIGVNQADGSAEGKKWLTMEHVANSKTAVQAEADFILGIGKTHDPGFELIRHLNISKNKLLGDEDTLPEERHGKMDVLIQPHIARYRDIN